MKKIAWVATLFCFCQIAAVLAQPAGVGTPDERLAYEQLFQETLKKPNDLDAAFKFAEIAAKLGEYEAAIGVLERMIFYNPGLSRVRLELGVLYFKLGSYAQARTYLTSAIEPRDTPDEVKTRVNAFLSEIGRREQDSALSGYAQFGARWQQNANAGPNSLNVRALGFDAVLDSKFGRRSDWNAFALGGVRHVYDFGSQTGDSWETNLNYYMSWQHRVGELDVRLGEVNTGPRFNVGGDWWTGLNIRPYFLVGGLVLGGDDYLHSHGYGVSLTAPVQSLVFEFGAETRRRVFQDSMRYSAASQQTGVLNTAFASVTMPVTGDIKIYTRGNYTWNSANFFFNSYVQTGYDAGFVYEFQSPLPDAPRRWSLMGAAGQTFIRYQTPNGLIDPTLARKDREYRFSAGIDAPVTDNFGFGVQLLYSQNSSVLANYRYRNFTVSFGPTLRF